MSKNNGSGCLAWIIIGFLVVAALSRCGKDDAGPAPTALANLESKAAPASWLYVRPVSLNCRAGPSPKSASLRTLAGGEHVGVLRTQGDWSQLDGGVVCWAKTGYLTREKPRPEEAPARKDKAKSPAGPLSSTAIKRRMIAASIESYPGNCPCPYNAARNGSRCGGRSAYSRGGGYAPICYAGDISASEVVAWREHAQ